MTHFTWIRLTCLGAQAALLLAAAAITGSAAIAQTSPAAGVEAEASKQAGPVQDFDWLYDQSLLKDDDDGDDDDDDDGGSIRVEENRTTTTTTVTETQVRYSDLSTTYWASSFIYRLSAIKGVSGFPGGLFLPSNSLTQAQFAAMVTRAFDRPAVRDTVVITNLSRSYWAYQAIQTAYSRGFITLNGSSFNPNQTLTRLELLVSLARGLGITQVSAGQSVDQLLSRFTDASSIPAEYRVIIAALVERGIIVNYPQVQTLSLFQTVTRAEACAFVYQSLVYLGKVEPVQSAYIVTGTGVTTTTTTTTTTETSVENGDDEDEGRRNCNQGIGNGAEGCDPGNSRPHGGSNDEGGRTPGAR